MEFSKIDFGTRLTRECGADRCTSSLANVRKTFSREVWCTKLKVMSCYDKELNSIEKLATDNAFHAMHMEKVVSCELIMKGYSSIKDNHWVEKLNFCITCAKLPRCLSTPSMSDLQCQMPFFGYFQLIMNRLDFGKTMALTMGLKKS
jgi:hypothetical protein